MWIKNEIFIICLIIIMIEIYCKNILSPFLNNYKSYGIYNDFITIKELKVIVLSEINSNKLSTDIKFLNDKYQYYNDDKKNN